jgi:hypothetical protein
MPGKRIKAKPSAGNPGLTPETTSDGQTLDHTMSPNASSVAAGELPRQETQADEGDAVIKAFDDLFDMSDDQTAKDPPPPHHDDEDLTIEEDNEEENVFLLPESQNFIPGTAEDFTEKMRFNGLG